ncbi:MAG: F0F1 ATP synthase subunit B [Clostridia bacterium]
MEELFNLNTIIGHTINALILLVAMYFLLYKPVRKFMNARADKINGQLDDAQKTQAQAQAALAQSQDVLSGTDHEIAQRLADEQKRLQVQRNNMLSDAKAEGDRIMAKARKEADMLLKNAHETMQRQAADLAIEIASKVLEREVCAADHEQMIADFLKKVA